jgi:amino acid transporter
MCFFLLNENQYAKIGYYYIILSKFHYSTKDLPMPQTSSGTKIGVATATIIGMNAMIGSGIFAVPATLATNVGPAGILAFIFVIIAVWFMAQSLARVAELYPEEGAFYTYAKQWSGHTGGMIASTAYFVGLLIAMGLLAQVSGIYLKMFFPSYSEHTLGLIALIALVILNTFGVVLSEMGQHILIVCTVFPLIATTIMCLTKADFNNLIPFAPHGFTNVLKATRVIIFGFFGFECATSLFNIVEEPQKNVPRALTYSIAIVSTIYVLFVGSVLLSTPLSYFTDPRMPVSDALKLVFPNQQWMISIIHASILSAILGTIHSMIWASSNLLTLLIKKSKSAFGKKLVSSGMLDQHFAVLFVGLCIFISYSTLKNLDLFFCLTSVFLVPAFMMSMITLLTLKSEWESGQNIKTMLGIITASVMLFFAVEGLIGEIRNVM